MSEVMVILVTVGSEQEAMTIAKTIVTEKLAACVNIINPIRSIYSWKGELCDDRELLLIIKTRSSAFAELRDRIQELHSYDVAEIIAFNVARGAQDYLDWVLENTTGG